MNKEHEQVINLFTYPARKYIVGVAIPATEIFLLSCSYETKEEAENSFNTHKSNFNKIVTVKIFEAIGNTDGMYIDVKEAK